MCYLYRLEDNFMFLHHGVQRKLDYLPVKNEENIKANAEVFIYLKNTRGSGIFAIGRTLTYKTYKYTKIPIEERTGLLNEECFQVKVDIHTCSIIPLIEEKYLRQFPSLNDKHIDITALLIPFTLYSAEEFASEYNFLQHRFYNIFNNGEQFYQDFFWMFGLHLLREEKVEKHWNKDLPYERKKCSECGLESEEDNFLEIHDCHKINFSDNYKPINIKDFHVLCPNCHKKRHNKIRTGTFRRVRIKEYKPKEEYNETIFKNYDFSIIKTLLIRDVKNDFPIDYFDKLKELNLLLPDEKIEDLLFRYWEKTKQLGIEGISFDGEGPYTFENDKGLSGYININLDIVIEAKYLYAGDFNNGFAVVSYDVDDFGENPNKCFFIDEHENQYHFRDEISTKQYTVIRDNSDGTFCVSDLKMAGIEEEFPNFGLPLMGEEDREIGGCWGYCDNKGKEIIKPQYIFACNFDNGLAKVCKGEWKRKEMRHNAEVWDIYESNEAWGIIDKTGKEIIPCKYELISEMLFDEKPMRIHDFFGLDAKLNPDLLAVKYNGKFGLINYKNEWIVEPQFAGFDCYMSEDGLILFSNDDVEKNPYALFGVYSIPEQRRIIEPKYQEINFLKNGHLNVEEEIGVSEDTKTTVQRIIDRTEKEIFPSDYDDIEPVDGVYIVTKWRNNEPNLKGIINYSGNVILPCVYPAEEFFIDKQLIVTVGDNGRFGLVTFGDDIIFPPVFSKIDNIENMFLLLEMCEPESFSMINKKGLSTLLGEIILPLEYDNIDFYDNLIIGRNREGATFFKVQENGKRAT